KNMGISGDELQERVLSICDLVGIPKEYLSVSPFDLSGGEKRRVAIAGVMAMRPEIIVFDEPVAGLDPRGRSDVVHMIRDYRDTYNATVLIVSHNMEDMAVLADKLIVMSNGSLVAFDETEKIFSDPDFLKEIGLNVPIVTQVFSELSKLGADVPSNIFTVSDAVAFMLSRKGGEGNA
ncbi:MAG: ATP-binding cassette domain-containing protein, partial [Acutalibacteraceae bacterium]|nr:ATP-binding cassette domain-containing protein [Acutalibacteraceae bacterium]